MNDFVYCLKEGSGSGPKVGMYRNRTKVLFALAWDLTHFFVKLSYKGFHGKSHFLLFLVLVFCICGKEKKNSYIYFVENIKK